MKSVALAVIAMGACGDSGKAIDSPSPDAAQRADAANPDAMRPPCQLLEPYPMDGATAVPVASWMTISFSCCLDSSSVESMRVFEDEDDEHPTFATAMEDDCTLVWLQSPEALKEQTKYTIVVPGGPSGILDEEGQSVLSTDFESSFTTGP